MFVSCKIVSFPERVGFILQKNLMCIYLTSEIASSCDCHVISKFSLVPVYAVVNVKAWLREITKSSLKVLTFIATSG